MHFKEDTELALFWKDVFPECQCIKGYIRLVCENTLEFSLALLSYDTNRLRPYVRDVLHFSLIAEYRDESFWTFLLSDTYNLQDLFGFDQLDLIIMIMLMLETLNQKGFYLPRTCYDVSNIKDCDYEMCSEATRRFLESCHFVPFGFALSP